MNGLLDDLMDTATEVAKESETSTETPAEATEEVKRETLTVSSLTDLPEGYVDVKGFAWALTQRNITSAIADNRTPGPDDMVDTQAVYAATKGKRWSLPCVEAVASDGSKGIAIPIAEGLAAWDERPERGAGSGSAVMTPERKANRILRAGKAKAQLAKLTKLVDRYGELLVMVDATWEDADKSFEDWAETEEGKKAIKDDEKKSDSNGE